MSNARRACRSEADAWKAQHAGQCTRANGVGGRGRLASSWIVDEAALELLPGRPNESFVERAMLEELLGRPGMDNNGRSSCCVLQ